MTDNRSERRPISRYMGCGGAALLCLVTVALLCFYIFSDPVEVVRAKAVTIGMDTSDVRRILGVEPAGYTAVGGHDGVLYGDARTWGLTLKSWIGMKGPDNYDTWPVHIRFDATGRVDRIKRGLEIVKAKP